MSKEGFAAQQSPAFLFSADGHSLSITDLYRGRSAFLVCGGPSLSSHDLSQLAARGILACTVNNAAALVRSQLWVGVDRAGNFCDAIWRDPGILKFVPRARLDDVIRVRAADGTLIESTERVGDMPAVFTFNLGGNFEADRFLRQGEFCWGNEKDQVDADGNAGVRSVMLVALKLLYVLGIRAVYLLGCDFRMSYGQANYAFAQDRTRSAVRSNNRTYRVLATRLARLKPYFEEAGFQVWNCTPNSGLAVFPFLEFEEAVARARSVMPKDIVTAGMYDPREKEAAPAQPVTPARN